MLKNYILISLFSLGVLLQSCSDFKKTDSGLKYKLIVDSAGENAKPGDLVIVELKYANELDTFDTKKMGRPVPIKVDSAKNGSLEEALNYVSKGDSVAVMVNNDSLYKKIKLDTASAKKIKPGSFTTFYMKVLDVYSPERVKQEDEKMKKRQVEKMKMEVGMAVKSFKEYKKGAVDTSKAQMAIDDKKIQSYIKKNNLKAIKTENGAYVVISQQGVGEPAMPGDSVVVTYVGKLLDGTVFDQSSPQNPFLSYMLSLGQLIPGFDEGVEQLKKGARATVFIPSALAYGKDGRRKSPTSTEYTIPPSSVLVFDIELVDVRKWNK